MSKFDKYQKEETAVVTASSAPLPQSGTDPKVFIAAAMAHAMMINKQTTSTIPRQAVEMAVAILKELESFYEK